MAVTEPVSRGREADYHAWYDNVQIPPFLQMEEVLRVARYRCSSAQLDAQPALPHEFVALYDLNAPGKGGLAAFAEKQFEAYSLGKVGNKSPGSDAYNQDSSRAIYYRQLGRRIGEPIEAAVPRSLLLVYSEANDEGGCDRLQLQQRMPAIADTVGVIAAAYYALTDLNVGRQFKPWPVPRNRLTVYELAADGAGELSHLMRLIAVKLTAHAAHCNNDCMPVTQCYELFAGPFRPPSRRGICQGARHRRNARGE